MQGKNKKVYLSLYSNFFLDYSLRGYSHRERWSRTDKVSVSKNNKEGEENMFMDVTPIGRGFILVKSWTTRRFLVLKQSNKAEMIARYDS
jgi:hypothetical protein